MLRRIEAKGALFVSALAFLTSVRAEAGKWAEPTCASYLRAIELSVQYNDPYLKQFYLDLADAMYASMNEDNVARGMRPLPMEANSDAQNKRATLVVSVCEDDTDETYAEAVSDAYMEMREAHGPSVRLYTKNQK